MPRHVAERVDQERLQRRLQERREDEQAPDAVDDAGNAGEQFDGDADRPAQPLRAQLGEKERDHQADRNRDQHGNERGDDGAVDRRQRAEIVGDRIPALADQKAEAEGAEAPAASRSISETMTPLSSNSTPMAAARVRWRNTASPSRSRSSALVRARASAGTIAWPDNATSTTGCLPAGCIELSLCRVRQESHSSGLTAAIQAAIRVQSGKGKGALSGAFSARVRSQ